MRLVPFGRPTNMLVESGTRLAFAMQLRPYCCGDVAAYLWIRGRMGKAEERRGGGGEEI